MIQFFLFALFFVLFTSRTLDFDLSLAPGLSVKNAFLYVIFGGLAIQTVLTRQRKLEGLSVILPFVVYVGYAIFSWIVILLVIKYPNYNIRTTLISLKSGPVEHLLVLLVYFYGISDSKSGLSVLRSMIWLIVIGNVVTVIDVLNVPDLGLIGEKSDEAGRTEGPIGNANEYAAFLALFMPAIVANFWTSHGVKKLLAGIGIFLSGLAFIMAVSRGAIFGLMVGAIVGAYYLRRIIAPQVLYRGAAATFLLCFIIGVGGFAAGYGDMLLDRFGLLGADAFQASSGRTVIWGRALESMLDHPMTFVTGFGWYAYETSRYFSYATHNTYLNILYNLGTIGVVFFLLVVGNVLGVVRASLGDAAHVARSWLIAFIFGFLALLVSIFFGELYSSWLYVWAYAGISLRIAVSETGIDETFPQQKLT